MKHFSALAIATILVGVACSGNDGGRLASSVDSTDQDPLFNTQLPPFNPQDPSGNTDQAQLNPQQPVNDTEHSSEPSPAGVTCDQFCATVDPRCATDCLEDTCQPFDRYGELCVAERNALFECALHAQFECTQEGQLRGGDVCETTADAWVACIEPFIIDRGNDVQGPNSPTTGVERDGGI